MSPLTRRDERVADLIGLALGLFMVITLLAALSHVGGTALRTCLIANLIVTMLGMLTSVYRIVKE